jgi:hypothetical protein
MEKQHRLYFHLEQDLFSKLYCQNFSKKSFLFFYSYPSGNLAISISEVARAMLLYTAFTDESTYTAKQIAQFDPFGNGYCNFINGKLRYEINFKIYNKRDYFHRYSKYKDE